MCVLFLLSPLLFEYILRERLSSTNVSSSELVAQTLARVGNATDRKGVNESFSNAGRRVHSDGRGERKLISIPTYPGTVSSHKMMRTFTSGGEKYLTHLHTSFMNVYFFSASKCFVLTNVISN